MEASEKIIRRIKGLLALSESNDSDEEAQSAFLMAQKLMIKYKISADAVESKEQSKEVIKGKATAYKTLYWWEVRLSEIIAKNFRVRQYFNNNYKAHRVKRTIIFLGFEDDVKIAKEMYILAYDVLKFYTERFISHYYTVNSIPRQRTLTNKIKKSYMGGFLQGLAQKFKEQFEELRQEYGLMVITPAEVNQQYDEIFKDYKGKGISFSNPDIENMTAFQSGYSEGKRVDYKKMTIDDEIFTY